MKERPVLFSGAMVRALLAGTKTQTRRVVRSNLGTVPPTLVHKEPVASGLPAEGKHWCEPGGWVRCPYGVTGDHLWVRERFAPVDAYGHKCSPRDALFVVLADGAQVYRDGHHSPALPEYQQGAFEGIKWRPSIHMPRWASRITLEVTEVRVQRLQDISEEDAIAEGVTMWDGEDDDPVFADPLSAYQHLWDSINGDRAPWSSSPWVWAVSFRVVR